jgi:oxygen-independent coproporphyrinogen-3 oxidase
VIGFEADRVACFNFAYLPVQLKHQAAIDPAALPAGVKKIELFCLACERFDSAGMRLVGMDHFAKEGDELSVAAREGTLWRNFQGYTTRRGVELVGLGMTAISDLGGCYAQNAKKLADYYRAVENSRFATARGWRLSEEDLRRREMIRELFCNGETKKPMSDVGCRMSELQCDGLIEIKSDKLTVTPLGRLFIRNIAMMFDEYLGTARTQFSKAV